MVNISFGNKILHNECNQKVHYKNDPTLCQYGYNPNCSQAHKQSQQTIEHIYVHRPPKFGALAYSSKVGHIAGSLNHNSKAEAQQAAIQRCQRGSKNTPCKVIAWVRNGCVAAAAGKIKNKFVVVTGAGHPGTVEQIALQNCKKGGLDVVKLLCLKVVLSHSNDAKDHLRFCYLTFEFHLISE